MERDWNFQERTYLPTLRMDFINCLNRVQMINTRIQPDLVHNHDARLLRLLVKLPHSRRDIAGGNNVCLSLDGGLNDGCVVRVWD